MPLYRHKPTRIDAVRYRGPDDAIDGPAPPWYTAARAQPPGEPGALWVHHGVLFLGTWRGVIHLNPGDWIAQASNGMLSRIPGELFDEDYEAVEPS